MSQFKIFVVEDDPWYGEMLKYNLSLNPDYEVELYDNAKACLSNLYLKPDVICVDYFLPDNSGAELFEQIKSRNPNVPVIVISGQEDISIVLDLLKMGVHDYIIKDDNTKDILRNRLMNIRETSNLKKEVETLKKSLEVKYDFQNTIIGQSKRIKESFDLIETAAKTNINVSVTGETGTGKELVAKAIHYRSDRKKKPFIAINMAAIPKELIESELFGHEKGSFTGAIARKIGKFEEADGGTIFLDEIAELDLNMQVKLLRVLQEREVVRIGGNKSIKFNAHLISATNKNLAEEVKKETFRKDLYYRMVGLPIELPPLRDRGNDVVILANHFVKSFCKENDLKTPKLSSESKEALMKYNYPGNVRELKSIVELACVMCSNGEITPSNINFNTQLLDEDSFASMEKTLKEYNADIITFFLKKYNNNVVEVAKKLDIGKSTIYNLIKAGEIAK
jgi:DNA-binding NtrC family response regulator